MGFEGTKFRVTTKVGKKKFVTIFNKPSSVDRYLAGARKMKEKYPHTEDTVITLKVIGKPKRSFKI